MHYASTALNKCHSIQPRIDRKRRRIATRSFSRLFPHAKGVRNKLFHSGEIVASHNTPRHRENPTLVYTGIGTCAREGFWVEWEKQQVFTHLNMNAVTALECVRDCYYAQFKPPA